MLKKIKTKYRLILTILFIALNALIIAITAVNEFGDSENAAELSEVKIIWWLLIPAALAFVVSIVASVWKFVMMIRELGDPDGKIPKKEIWKTAWRVLMLGRYYDNVTPAAVGGQPFQIYYMHKYGGISSGHASSIPIFGMVSTQIGFIIIALFCFTFGNVFGEKPTLQVMAWVGLAFCAFWPTIMIGIKYFPEITMKFIRFCVLILSKVRIIKDYKKAISEVEKNVREYSSSVNMIFKSRKLFIKVVLLSVIFNFLTVLIPFFVVRAFGGNIGFIECFTMTVAVMAAVYFIPTPGNAGAAEGTFYAVFSSLSTGYIFWAMLVWRFFTFFVYIIVGPLIHLHMYLEKKHNKKPGKHKKL